jgi:hypothetical protein
MTGMVLQRALARNARSRESPETWDTSWIISASNTWLGRRKDELPGLVMTKKLLKMAIEIVDVLPLIAW